MGNKLGSTVQFRTVETDTGSMQTLINADESFTTDQLHDSSDEIHTTSEGHSGEEDTLTLVTTLDDSKDPIPQSDGATPPTIHQENFKIPENLLKKLSSDDWNELVHFICSSMEQSFQSNMQKTVDELKDIATDNNKHAATDTVQRRHHYKKALRPKSMPATLNSSTEPTTRRYSAAQRIPNDTDRHLKILHTQKVRLATSKRLHTYDLLLNGPSGFKAGKQKGYLTLEQLKDLGLTLQHESSHTTSERMSSFSMKCWQGEHSTKKHSKTSRRHTRKSSSRQSATHKLKCQFEELCLLGPQTATGGHTLPKQPPPLTSESPDVMVEHLHQHHHYHHFTYHSNQ